MSKTTNYLGSLALVMAVILSLSGSPLLAQGGTGKVEGTVTDSTGAVLPGVEVTIANVDTGQSRMAITGDEGRYSAAQLATGNYEVRAELAGFQTGVRQGIRLLVGQEAVVDFTLGIGSITQEVVVTGEAPLVNTTSSTISDVINEIQIHELPLNSRDLTQLSLLTPGVVQLRTGVTGGVTLGAPSVRVSIGGARIYQTGFLLDGSDVTDSSRGMGPGGAAGSMFGVETVKEFQVITNNYSAEYGRFSGGLMSMVTKSGTNAFHGSLFYFHRNDNLDATNFFNNSFGLEKPEFRRHQFGATVGGPIIADRTFFFFSYEGFREGLGVASIQTVPTAQAKLGLFQPDSDGTCDSLTALIPGTGLNPNGLCQVPLHAEIGPFLNLFEDPTGDIAPDGITGDFASNLTQPTNENFYTARVDHAFSDSDSFFARYTTSAGDKDQTQDGLGSSHSSAVTSTKNDNHYSTLEWKHIFSASSINTFRFGAQRNVWKEVPTNPGPLDVGFFPGRAMGVVAPGDGVHHAGNNVEGQNVSNQFSYADDLFITRGRHDLKLGVQAVWHQTNDFTLGRGGGEFTFRTVAEFVAGQPYRWRGKIPEDRPQRGARQTVLGFYIQDDFKWKPNLTINLGLRYEPTVRMTESNKNLVNLHNPLTDTESFFGDPYFIDPSNLNFAPRIGIAWDPFSDGKTSIRIGYGIFHETILPFHYTGAIRRSPPLALSIDYRDAPVIQAQFPNAPQEALDAVGSTLTYQWMEYEPSQPYMQQWNLSLQRELATNFSVTAAYVGSKGTNLQFQRQINSAVPEVLPDGRKLFRSGLPRRNLAWGHIYAWEFSTDSFYHGLQFGGRQRFSDGLQFQVAYTFGRSIDNASRSNFSDIQENRGKYPQDAYDITGSNRALSAHDVRHTFSVNYVYEFPRMDLSGAASAVLNGWQLNGILTLTTGNPITIQVGTGSNLTDYDRDRHTSSNAQRPSLAPGADLNAVREEGRDPTQYFDPNAFILGNPGFYGDVGRNTIIGPGINTFDFSLIKNTSLAEEVNLQFRAEFFNIFNRANFGSVEYRIFSGASIQSVPCSTYGATGGDAGCSELLSASRRSTAGRITQTRTSNRQIQVGLRLVF